MRVVLYAEGGRETSPARSVGFALGEREILHEDQLGPAHFLLRRILAEAGNRPEATIHFEEPKRVRGRKVKGSHLLRASTLRQLLSYSSDSPALGIVLVDEDGSKDRRQSLRDICDGLPLPRLIAVARQEFEAWLLVDRAALAKIGITGSSKPKLESFSPGEAKGILDDALSEFDFEVKKEKRISLAKTLDLEAAKKHSSSFATCLSDAQSCFPSS